MLKSIGMEQGQLLKMLCWESGSYLLYTYIFAAIIGSAVSLLLLRPFSSSMTWLSYQFTRMLLLYCIPVLLVLVFLVPFLAYHKSSKDSIVELLREE